jgi:glyoxylase-like metal-dependent hydrolase (beta-lactamase superfamily II)
LGIEPDGVERVIMMHAHVDHTSGMRLLPNPEFACSATEYSPDFHPGRTACHLSVLLRLTHDRQVLVVGDAAYTLRNIPWGILDDDEARNGLDAGDQGPHGARARAILVPTHDPSG